jgi:hypothetical protein
LIFLLATNNRTADEREAVPAALRTVRSVFCLEAACLQGEPWFRFLVGEQGPSLSQCWARPRTAETRTVDIVVMRRWVTAGAPAVTAPVRLGHRARRPPGSFGHVLDTAAAEEVLSVVSGTDDGRSRAQRHRHGATAVYDGFTYDGPYRRRCAGLIRSSNRLIHGGFLWPQLKPRSARWLAR